MVAVVVRDAVPPSPRGGADDANDANDVDRELRVLRSRWRTASLANGWRFPGDWSVPEVDEVCASLVHRTDITAALAGLARARAQSGVGLNETLIDLAALHAVISDPGDVDGLVSADPDATPSGVIRVAALAWADESVGELAHTSCTHKLTGLTTCAYLRTRLGEVYRQAARDGRLAHDSHVLLVINLDLAEVAGWSRLMAMVLVADALRQVFNGAESAAVLGPAVAVVLAEREPSFGQRALSAGWLINERLRTDPDLATARHPQLRVIGLPDTEELAGTLLRHLSSA